jgi:hypothetical protein
LLLLLLLLRLLLPTGKMKARDMVNVFRQCTYPN